jgi:hypothetical protein
MALTRINGNLISSGTITGNLFLSNTITGNLIAPAAVTGDKIGLTAITGNLVASATITGDKIGLNAITSNLISANAITTAAIADGSINTSELAAGAVTSDKIASSISLTTPILGTPTSGNLANCTVDGTDAVGFRNLPVNSQSAAYTTVLADSGKIIFHPSSDTNARTFTIPAASSVAYPIGTALSFINLTANVVTIAITTDTMYLSSAGTTGSRSLAQYGSATAIKVSGLSSSGIWLISGSGLT